MNTANTRRGYTLYLAQLAILIAILLFLEVTGLGFIRTPGLEFTIMSVPVIVGAITLGPLAGTVLGGVFGLTSFWEALSGKSAFGATLLNLNPVGTLLTAVPTRILMGLLCALLFRFLRDRMRNRSLPYFLSALAGSLLNTVLFMGMFVLFFFNTDFVRGIAQSLGTTNVFAFIAAFVGIQGLAEAVICTVIGSAVSRALARFSMNKGAGVDA